MTRPELAYGFTGEWESQGDNLWAMGQMREKRSVWNEAQDRREKVCINTYVKQYKIWLSRFYSVIPDSFDLNNQTEIL